MKLLSALDEKTEKDVVNSIQSIDSKKTVLIIAHRLSTIKHADRIVCVENGKIITFNSFSEYEKKTEQFIMCGLVGYIESKNGANCSSDIDKAIASLEHRGPDASGKDEFYTNKKVGLGHRRLSILDISDAGNQPMESFTGRFKIIFNGEIYNHLEIREYYH